MEQRNLGSKSKIWIVKTGDQNRKQETRTEGRNIEGSK